MSGGRVPEADVVRVTKKISSQLRQGKWRQALLLFHAANNNAVETNLVSFNVILSALATGSAWMDGLSRLTHFSATSPADDSLDQVSFNTVGSSLCGGQWAISLNLLGVACIARVELDIIGLSSACKACSSRWRSTLQLLRQAEAWALLPNCIFYGAAMTACEKAGQWFPALRILVAPQVHPDVVNFNAAISALAVAGRASQAQDLLDCMAPRRLYATTVSYNAAIASCVRRGAWPRALLVLQQMPAPDVISYGSAISSCEKGAQPFVALRLLRDMREVKIAPNEVCCSAAVSACEKIGLWSRALSVLFSMPSSRVIANVISFNAAISACEKGRSWLQALQLFAHTGRPDEITHRAAITAACQELHWLPALILLKDMEELGLEAGAQACGFLINACDSQRQVDSSQRFSRRLGQAALARLHLLRKGLAVITSEFDLEQKKLETRLPALQLILGIQ
eukprot:s910_g6.t2